VNEQQQLIAYLATLGALVVVFLAAMVAASTGNVSSLEALGAGTVTGGLIGILRFPQHRNVTVDNPPSDPVPVEPGREP
jgi:hypothetical protein